MDNVFANIEDSYLSGSETIRNSNYVVLTGCSGGGKSTLLTKLASRGFRVVVEPGREIVREQTAINGRGLPWVDLDLFLELALSRYMHSFLAEKERQDYVFFDRGILDAVQPDRNQGAHFSQAASKFRYAEKVFFLPPWKEIYKNDPERKHTFDDAVHEYNSLLKSYKNYGYQVILVPKAPVEERVNFILGHLNS